MDSFYVRVVNLQWDDFDSYRWFFRSVVDETKGHEDSQTIIRKALVFWNHTSYPLCSPHDDTDNEISDLSVCKLRKFKKTYYRSWKLMEMTEIIQIGIIGLLWSELLLIIDKFFDFESRLPWVSSCWQPGCSGFQFSGHKHIWSEVEIYWFQALILLSNWLSFILDYGTWKRKNWKVIYGITCY